MDRYHEMVVFQAIAAHSSLASAARSLELSGPTVVRAIACLETRLGVELLQRSTRGVVLTEAGSRFLADCSRILKEVEEAEAYAKGLHVQARGNLAVLMPLQFSSQGMASMLVDYLDLYPEVRLYAEYHDRFPNMHEEGLDVAVLVGNLPSSSLIARKVGYVRHVVCASPDYLEAHGEPRVPADVKQHRLIDTGANRSWAHWDFQEQGALHSIKARSGLSCATVQSAIDAAVHGAGLTRCLSHQLHEYLQSGRLRRLLQPYELPALPVQVVYREGLKASMRVRSFVDFAVGYLRRQPALSLD
ncbi:LysR family transcriptional regulator [Pseudomonas akapageensis]|uniref:LysR family transcriptional regulator n=1 Tax=Pseudomonas akapageensis TaxID=2609961 RepID=UPI00140D1D58|nr:LysR family transcriptional regulator [Pseudomonas akapageensis]